MTELVSLDNLAHPLAKPYVITRSKLGSTTKVIEEKFVCSSREIDLLFDSLGEKIRSFDPSKAGFQFLVSYTDNTHYENSHLSTLVKNVSNSNKCTEKLILSWKLAHEYDGTENEMSITVRISNPINPIVMLQAAMSQNHMEADMLSFEDGSVSVSVHGATQITAEEIFSIVQRWAEACPQPQSITGINSAIYRHSEKIEFLNFWVFPILYIVCGYLFLSTYNMQNSIPYAFIAFSGLILVRSAAQNLNSSINKWAHNSRRFSLFLLTGGDQNQQTKIAARSKNHTIKLVVSVLVSFMVNIFAGIVLTKFIFS